MLIITDVIGFNPGFKKYKFSYLQCNLLELSVVRSKVIIILNRGNQLKSKLIGKCIVILVDNNVKNMSLYIG